MTLESLLKRKEKAEAAYLKARIEGNEKLAKLGWGHAMRRVKMPRFTKEDNARDRLEKINELIATNFPNHQK